MSNSMIKAIGGVRVDGRWVKGKNSTPPDKVMQLAFEATIRGQYNYWAIAEITAGPSFLRPGPKRYRLENALIIGNPQWSWFDKYNTGVFEKYISPGNYDTMGTDYRLRRKYQWSSLAATSDVGYAFGSVATVGTYGSTSGTPAAGAGEVGPPSGYVDKLAYSFIDMPGTRIGNIFKHPVGRTAWFNETGVIALSQGDIEVEGPFAPPEHLLAHLGYQIYYTKSGGTGRPGHANNPDLPSPINGANGQVSTGSDNFVDGESQGLFLAGVHDQGNHYIRIQSGPNRGTFLITSVVDTNTVTVDASTINQPFSTETGISWEMVSGPVGEYFWRRRPYACYDYWSSSIRYHQGNYIPLLQGMNNEVRPLWGTGSSCTVSLHDRGACWWALTNNNPGQWDGCLVRYVHLSPQAFEAVYPNNISGAPAGIAHWSDMVIDDQNKIWISWRDNNTLTGYGLMRIDPYPGGDAKNPSVVSLHGMSNTGLPSDNVRGLVADNSKVYAPGTRIWVFFGPGSPGTTETNGGIAYTDDYGTTWKRIHQLHARTGTASVSNGDTAVTGVGTAFTTEFAVGDWIRFAGDDRSYEIAAITSDTSMTLATAHATGVSGVTIERGGLTAAQAVIYQNTSTGNEYNGNYQSHYPCDYDSDGNVYWITEAQDAVCKWDESAGKVTTVTVAQMSTQVAVSAGANGPKTLSVQRIPDPCGLGPAELHNSIWVGTQQEGVVRLDPVFDGTHTRYHWNLTDNWPSTIDMHTAADTHYESRVVIEPVNGQASIWGRLASWYYNNDFQYSVYGSKQLATDPYLGKLVDNGSAHWASTADWYSNRNAIANAEFDDVGLGSRWVQQFNNAGGNGTESYGSIINQFWICHMWTGSEWKPGPVNQINSNIDFAGVEASFPGPRTEYTMSVGKGLRRMHPQFEFLDKDTNIKIRFVNNDEQSVSQDQQFIIDETSTFICFVGSGKDNTQEAQYFVDQYTSPTVYRLNQETPKTISNQWTVDGGQDGGFTHGFGNWISVFPTMARGFAEHDEWWNRQNNAPYIETETHDWYNPSATKAFGAYLRIKPEGEFSGDGSVTAGSDLFTTSGAHTFTAEDVGKSIFIEGANGATQDVDNGQAVILAVNSATEVKVDKTFAATRTGLRWKLMNIPAASYIVAAYEYAYIPPGVQAQYWRLYSSLDRGLNWDIIKKVDPPNNVTVNGDLSTIMDPGVFFIDHLWSRRYLDADDDPAASFAIVFDITDLPEASRRRQYWKIVQVDTGVNYGDARFSGIHVLDENMNPLGVPANNLVDDALDPSFFAFHSLGAQILVRPVDSSTISPVDDGDGDQFTNKLQASVGTNFYEQTGSNNASLSGNQFTSAGATFVPEDVGKFLRIENASNPENDGWALITAYVDSQTVDTDKAFTDETNTFDWQVLAFGENDYVRIDDNATYLRHEATVVGDVYYPIADVPAADVIVLQNDNFPLSITNKNFDINRDVPDGISSSVGGAYVGFDSKQMLGYSARFGTLSYSQGLEFVVLEEDLAVASAATGADDDGDGRVDTVILPVTLTSEAVVGDYLLLDGTGGRRVYEISSITRDSPAAGQTEVKVTYDEIFPNGTFTWQVLRRRNLKAAWRRSVYVLNTSSP